MLKQQIQSSVNGAMKAGDQFLVGTLRLLLASVLTKEKDKRYKISKEKSDATEEILVKESQLTDEQILEVVSSEIKKRKDAIVLYIQGKRPELAEKEQKEIDILKKYLPEQLTEVELRKIIEETVAEMSRLAGSALGGKDMGKVMTDLNSKIKGKADGGEVSKIIKELLAK
jgi:uncharacterized protein YqeY